MKYEYKVELYFEGTWDGAGPDSLQDKLAKRGQEGWELVSATKDLLFFKRPLPE